MPKSKANPINLTKKSNPYISCLGIKQENFHFANLFSPGSRCFWLKPKNRDLWEKSKGEPALVTAVTLSTHVQKPSLNLNACAWSKGTRISWFMFLISSRASCFRSALTWNARGLGTRLLNRVTNNVTKLRSYDLSVALLTHNSLQLYPCVQFFVLLSIEVPWRFEYQHGQDLLS